MVDPCGQPPVAEKWMRSAERLLKIRGEYGQAAMSSAKRASSLTSMAPPGLTSAGDSQRARHVRRSSVSSKPSSAAALRQVGIGQEACREDEAGEEPFVPIDLEGDERAAHLAGAQLGQQRGRRSARRPESATRAPPRCSASTPRRYCRLVGAGRGARSGPAPFRDRWRLRSQAASRSPSTSSMDAVDARH